MSRGYTFLAALVVPRPEALGRLEAEIGLTEEEARRRPNPDLERAVLEHLQPALATFPGYAKLPRLALVDGPWSVENGSLTPTLKLRRGAILARHRADLERLYAGH